MNCNQPAHEQRKKYNFLWSFNFIAYFFRIRMHFSSHLFLVLDDTTQPSPRSTESMLHRQSLRKSLSWCTLFGWFCMSMLIMWSFPKESPVCTESQDTLLPPIITGRSISDSLGSSRRPSRPCFWGCRWWGWAWESALHKRGRWACLKHPVCLPAVGPWIWVLHT